MSVTYKLKRRTAGMAGAPAALLSGELAYNQIDGIIYIGFGDDGAGNATSIKAAAGDGGFLTLGTAQTVSGAKTFSGSVSISGLLSLTGGATTTTPSTNDNSTTIPTTAWVRGQGFLSGNQTITVSGDVSGSGSTTLTLILPTIMTAGTYPKLTVNAKGQVVGGSGLSASDIPAITSTLISDFDARVRTMRLDQMAAPTSAVSLNGQTLTDVGTPSSPTHAANKGYVDSAIQGLTPKPTATVTTVTALPANTSFNGSGGVGATLTGTANSALTVDSYAVKLGDLILVRNEAIGANNGLYVLTTLGTASVAFVLTRHVDMDSAAEIAGAFVPVGTAGSTLSNTLWLANPGGSVTVGTTAIPFTQLNASTQVLQGNGISVSGTAVSVATVSSNRIAVSASGIDLTAGIATAGTYKSLTVDTYGRVTGGTNPTTLSGFGITDAQPLASNLTALAGLASVSNLGALAGLTGSANTLPVFTGAGAMTVAQFTAFGQQLVAATGAAAVLAILGIGTMGTQNANAVSITGGSINGIVLDGGTF